MPIDRNARAREEFDLARRRHTFTADLDAGRAAPLDRLGNPIAVGDLILYHPPQDLIFQILAVDPLLDTQQPPGLVRLKLQTAIPLTLRVNLPAMGCVLVGHVTGPTPETGSAPPSATPPPETAVGSTSTEIVAPAGEEPPA